MGIYTRVRRHLAKRLYHWHVLREAKEVSLQRANTIEIKNLLIVCYGNIYRSAYIAEYIKQNTDNTGIHLRSGGFYPKIGRSSPNEHIVMSTEYEIDLSGHRSRLISQDDLNWADAILIMDRFNLDLVLDMDKTVEQKVLWMGAFDTKGKIEIDDPYNKTTEQARLIVEQMNRACQGFLSQLRNS